MAEANLSVKRGCFADFASYGSGLRKFWDPRGRSARSELAMLAGVPMALFLVLAVLFGRLIPVEWSDPLRFAYAVLFSVPLPAAAARRFHDMGKSGWLALPVLALVAIGLWDAWLDVAAGPFAHVDLTGEHPPLGFLYGASCMLFVVLLMLPPKDEGNRYGPNPRPAPKVI